MATVIKPDQLTTAPRGVAFNLDDLSRQAEDYLARVREQAKQLLVEAGREAEQIRQRAQAEGRRDGQRAVERLIEQQVQTQMRTALPALEQAARQLADARQAWLAHWERRAVHLAAAMAARVIRRELSRDPQISLRLVRECLELAGGASHLKLRIHPQDQAALGPALAAVVESLATVAPAEIVPDPQITPGGCRVETLHGAIDQQIEQQLARLEAELT